MSKITSITPEQQQLLVKYYHEWFKLGSNTSQVNREEAEAVITKIYARNNYERPEYIWCDSPYAANFIINNSKKVHLMVNAIEEMVKDRNLNENLFKIVKNDLGRISLRALKFFFKSFGKKEPSDQDVKDALAIVKKHLSDSTNVNNYIGIENNTHWVAFYAYCREIGVDYEDKNEYLDIMIEFIKKGTAFFPFSKNCIVVERPTEIHWNEEKIPRIHNPKGPAVAYKDGYSVYAWNATLVPWDIIEKPQDITIERISAENNAEIKRIMREIYGESRFLKDTGAKLVDADNRKVSAVTDDGVPRALVSDNEGRKFLVGTDHSTQRVYYMEAPREAKSCREAHEAICGFNEDDILGQS